VDPHFVQGSLHTAVVPLHSHVPQQPQEFPGLPASVPQPPHAFTHGSSHQLSFLSALHFHVPQQLPQLPLRV
jgi:hypothetical protein